MREVRTEGGREGGKERREGGGEREEKDGGGGGGRRPLGKSRRTDTDGFQGGITCRGGDVAGGGDDPEGEGGVLGIWAGGISVEILSLILHCRLAAIQLHEVLHGSGKVAVPVPPPSRPSCSSSLQP